MITTVQGLALITVSSHIQNYNRLISPTIDRTVSADDSNIVERNELISFGEVNLVGDEANLSGSRIECKTPFPPNVGRRFPGDGVRLKDLGN